MNKNFCEYCKKEEDEDEYTYLFEIEDNSGNTHTFCSRECTDKVLGEGSFQRYFDELERKSNIHTIDMNSIKIKNDNYKYLGWVVLTGSKKYDADEEVIRFDTIQKAAQYLKQMSFRERYAYLGVELPYYYVDIHNIVIRPFDISNDGINTKYFNKHQDDVSLYRKFAAFTTYSLCGRYENWHISNNLENLKEACLGFHNLDISGIGICEIIDFKKVGNNIYIPKIWITEGQKWINGWSTIMWD